MAKRLFDIMLASALLVALAPLLGLAAIGVKLSSPGPAIYRARRVGRGGKDFTMFKFRSMKVDQRNASRITLPSDPRVFPFGRFIRHTKVDELPQLFNILRGEMSFVGPRPEAPSLVEELYTDWMIETLAVRPGITSPGALYNYTHGHRLLDASDPEGSYASRLLAPKLALDRAYVEEAGLLADLAILFRTLAVIVQRGIGRKAFPLPPETPKARLWSDVPQN
jgi:lipopolysaccharide/colanic/teichoic acid biosynthesis glycosyltransferase